MNTDKAIALLYVFGGMIPIALFLNNWLNFFEPKEFIMSAVLRFIFYDIFLAFGTLGIIWAIEHAKRTPSPYGHAVLNKLLRACGAAVGIAVGSLLLLLFGFIVLVLVFGEGSSAGWDFLSGKTAIPFFELCVFAFLVIKNAVIYWKNQKLFWVKGSGTTITAFFILLYFGFLGGAIFKLVEPFSLDLLKPLFSLFFFMLFSAYFFLIALFLWLPVERAKQITLNMYHYPIYPWKWFGEMPAEFVDSELERIFEK